LSQRVQQIFNVPMAPPGDDAVVAIQRFRKLHEQAATEVELNKQAAVVADQLMRGIVPDVLTREIADQVDVREIVPFQGELATRYSAMSDLMNLLVRASLAEDSHAERRAVLARAALVLSAQDRLMLGSRRFAAAASIPGFVEVLQLDPQQKTQITELAAELIKEGTAAFPHYKATSRSLQSLIDSPRDEELWGSAAAEFEAQLRDGWTTCPNLLTVQHIFATDTWRLICLAQANNKNEVADRLVALTKDLERITSDAIARRWLEQAATLRGPVPKRAGVKVLDSPNDLKRGKPN
jgi:hypothetical protein